MKNIQKICIQYTIMSISKINSRIYIGSYKYPIKNPEEFQKLKIDSIICCAAEGKFPDEMSIVKYPIEKNDNVSFTEHMDDAIATIHKLLQKKKIIYLCSSDGNSRAPAVLIYYLMVYRQMNYFDAHDAIEKIREDIDIDWEFINVLQIIEN